MGCLDHRGNCYTGMQSQLIQDQVTKDHFCSQLWGIDIEFMTFCHRGNMKILKFIDGEFYDPSWCVEYHRLRDIWKQKHDVVFACTLLVIFANSC